jgi:F420-dependent methylenetetrahydromethanopterin dehydrogenase
MTEVPGINDVVDVDKLVKNIYYSNNVDPDIIRTEDETEELRAQRAQADAEAQSAMMMAEKVAPIDMTKAPEEGSLLQDAQNQGLAL